MWTCFVFLFIIIAVSLAQFQEMRACLEQQLHGHKYKRLRDPLFSVVYGDAAVEILNAYSTYEMKELEALAHCYQQQESLNVEGGNFKHEIPFSLITNLLPNFSVRLIKVLEEGFNKARWDKDVLKNPVLSNIYFVASEGMPIDSYLEELKLKQRQKLQERSVFVIGPLSETTTDTTHVEIIRRDNKLRELLTEDYSEVYQIIFLLCDRSKFFGGEIIIDYESRDSKKSTSLHSQDIDEYDDELIAHVVPNYQKPELDKLSLEKGSVLVIHPSFRHGVTPVQYGKRIALTIQMQPPFQP